MHATKTPAPRSKAGCGCGTCANCSARSPAPERSSVAPPSTGESAAPGRRDDRTRSSPFGFTSNGTAPTIRTLRMKTGPGGAISERSIVDDGGGGAETTTKDAGSSFCKCTPTSAAIKNVKKLNNGTSYGHEFDFEVGLTYATDASAAASTDCTLEWWEKTSRPPAWQTVITAGTWNDMFALYPSSPTFAGWTARTKPCPGSETAKIHDPPAADTSMPARTLEFDLKVKGGGVTKSATGKQTLVPDGKGGITTQDFTT